MSVTITLYKHACLLELHLTSRYVWISCNLLASTSVVVGLNQQEYTCHRPKVMSLWSYPTNGLVSTIAPDHQACMLQLHLTISHVITICLLSACMSATVSSYQHPCILHLHQTINHVCNNCNQQLPCLSQLHLTNSHVLNLLLHFWYTCTGPAYIFIIAISNHLFCLLHLYQTRIEQMVVTIAPDQQACILDTPNQQSGW